MIYDYDIMTTRERVEAYYTYMLNRDVCVTFACAMSQLFAQVGMQSTVIAGDTANGEWHAWNIVMIDGENYFCGSIFELSFNFENAFFYFGITIKDRLADGSGFFRKAYGCRQL